MALKPIAQKSPIKQVKKAIKKTKWLLFDSTKRKLKLNRTYTVVRAEQRKPRILRDNSRIYRG